MPLIEWMPVQAGGINLYEDISSLPGHQLVQCDNYYPRGRRWRTIEGNSTFVSAAITPRTRHLVEFQEDDTAGGTVKNLIRFTSAPAIQEIGTGTSVALTGPAISSSQTLLWDTTVFTGILLMANGSDNLMETSDAATYIVTTGSPPTAPRYVEAWKNRVFLAGRSAAPMSIHYCADGNRNLWTGTDAGTEVITSPVGDFVTGIRSVENYLAIFTRRTVTALIGDHPDDWSKRTLYEDHGCVSHRTIARVNGGLVYANNQGVWLLTADLKRIELSADIRDYWINRTSLSTRRNVSRGSFMHAVYDSTMDLNRYYIWVSEGTSTAENVCWIFHFNSGQWTRMTSFMDSGQTCQASCLRENNNGNLNVYFAAGLDDNTTADKRVYSIDGAASFASLTGGNIASTLQTGILFGYMDQQNDIKGLSAPKVFHNFYPKLTTTTTASTNSTMNFNVYAVDYAVQSASRAVLLTSSTADIVRPRVAIGRTGWGLQLTLTYTGQVAHSFMGGVFEYDEYRGL